MTKIYEALEHAYRERKRLESLADIPASDHIPMPEMYPHDTPIVPMEEEMLALYKSIDSLLHNTPKKCIQFIGTKEGEGTSTVVREFARTTAMRIGKSVLLLDIDRVQPCQHLSFGITPKCGWIEVVKGGRKIEEALYQIEKSKLFVAPSSNSSAYTPEFFDFHWIDNYLKAISDRFDIILIDSSPFTSSPDGLAIAPKTDGVVIVVEAEKTKWTAVENVKEKISKVGGHILGIVFNKRKYYIPQPIYKRL